MKHAGFNVGYLLAVVLLALLPHAAQANDYPERSVRLLVGLAAGGGTDKVTRIARSDACCSCE